MAEENPQGNVPNSGQNTPQNSGVSSVSLDDATIQRIADASSRQAAQNVNNNGGSQQQNSGAESNQNQNGAQGNSSGQSQNDVLTAIQALPEQITRSIQEALQPPKNDAGNQQGNTGAQSNSSGQGQSQNSGQQEQTQTPGKKKGFADWWFGS